MSLPSVNVQTAKQWLINNEAILIDVREPAEYEDEKIANASLLPLASVCGEKLKPFGEKKVIVYCRTGKRSAEACKKLLAQNAMLAVYSLEGGIIEWAKTEGTVSTLSRKILPLDQQVQLTIGSGILLGCVLGYFYQPWWIGVSAFFGCGLIFAGLTGNCYLAKLMAKMPWNQLKQGKSCHI